MPDILCRHYHDESLVRSRFDDFRSLMGVVDLTGPLLDGAFSSEGPDLDDGIVRATASSLAPRPSSRATRQRTGGRAFLRWTRGRTERAWGRAYGGRGFLSLMSRVSGAATRMVVMMLSI